VPVVDQKIADLERLRAEDQRLLSTYEVDQRTGQIRIPIERAMAVLVSEYGTPQPATAPAPDPR
jgi:hypothetical protein